MKKTLSLLAGISLALSTVVNAADVTVRPYGDIQSPTEGNTLGLSATLINSSTGGSIWYDLRTDPKSEPPFDIDSGHIQWGLELANNYNESIELDSLELTDGDTLILDFTKNLGNLSGPVDAEYFVVMFRHNTGTGDYFSSWYNENSVGITGRFNNGDYTAYVIADTCDKEQTASTYGGLVFFNNSVAQQVRLAEVPVGGTIPEPTTATLSLLALAGLAARRRRK